MPISFAVLVAAAAVSQPPQQPAPQIVVTGKSIASARAALDRCIAAGCKPIQEVAATIALAEAQYLEGDFGAARRTAKSGLKRNRQFASSIPIELSNLTRVSARMAAHLGLADEMRHESINNVAMLRKHVGPANRNALFARAEMGDSFLQSGRPIAAREIYADMARDAAGLGVYDMEGLALLRLAALDLQLARSARGEAGRAAQSIGYLRASTRPEHAVYAQAATVLDAVMLARDGEDSKLENAIARLRATPGPELIYAPPIKLAGAPDLAAGNDGVALSQGDPRKEAPRFGVADNWFDMGFHVAADGRVSDIQVLRSGKRFDGRWYAPVARSVAGRRYTASSSDPTAAGAYRVERYTLTYPLATGSGTHLVQRGLTPMISRIDLTADSGAGGRATTGA